MSLEDKKELEPWVLYRCIYEKNTWPSLDIAGAFSPGLLGKGEVILVTDVSEISGIVSTKSQQKHYLVLTSKGLCFVRNVHLEKL